MAKVMLVEDDNNLREIYEARLAAEGYDIVAAQDGEEALALAVKERPDLIIADIMMPKVSGFDMLDILRSTPETKHAKIIMMTALSQAEDKARAEKLGADRYLVKSQVTLEDVVKVASEMLSTIENNPEVQSAPTPSLPSQTDPVSDSPTIPSMAPDPIAVVNEPAATQPPAVEPSTPPAEPTDDTSASTPVADEPEEDQSAHTQTQPHAPGTTITPDAVEQPSTDTAAQAKASTLSTTTSTEKAEVTEKIDEFISQNPSLSTSAEPEKDKETTASTPEAAPSEEAEKAEPTPELSQTVPTESSAIVEEPLVIDDAPSPTTSIPITVANEEVKEEPLTETSPENTEADQTMANAVDNLMGKDSDTSQEPAGQTEESKTSDAPQLAKKRGGERVITPLSDPRDSGPDLDALLAKEEENNGIAPPPTNAVIAPGGGLIDPAPTDETPIIDPVTDASSGTVVPSPPSDGETPKVINPNNIAL